MRQVSKLHRAGGSFWQADENYLILQHVLHPHLEPHIGLKILSNQNINLCPLRLVFPYLIKRGVLMGSKMTIGCLGKSKMWFSIKTYKFLKYCCRFIFQFQLQFSLWYNYIHTNQTANVQFSMTSIICF